MIRALIADDEAPARDKLTRWLALEADVEVIAQAREGLEAARLIEELRPEVAFLDIQMPGISGLEIAAQLEPPTAPLIVFVTAHDAHAIRAFDLSAVDYLLKPYDRERLRRTLERVRERLRTRSHGDAVHMARAQTNASQRLLVQAKGKLMLVDAADVIWLEASDNYVNIHTAQATHLVRRTLQDLLEQLGSSFVRIHRSSAVNIAEISALTPMFKGDYELTLRTGQVLRLSRRYRDDLFARMPR